MNAIRTILLALAVAAAAAMPLAAQDRQVLRIRAIVNDDVISYYDVYQRMRLVLLTSALRDTPENRKRITPQVLRNMIDEKLRLQEADRLNIKISDSQIDQQIGILERRNKLPPGGITRILDRAKIDVNSLRNKLRGEISWQRIVERRLAKQVNISNEDIEEELDRLKSIQHLPKYQVSEIFLPVDKPDQDGQVLDVANRLIRQIEGGAKFASLAREFSQSSSAATGGNLGTVYKGQLEPKLEKALDAMEPGGLSGPIRTLAGYYILRLEGRSAPNQPQSTPDAEATISQIVLPLAAGATSEQIQAQQRIAAEIRRDTKSCSQFEKTAKTLQTPQSGSLGKIKLASLPDPLRKAVSSLTANQISEPVRVAEGLLLMMVCERDTDDPSLPSRKEIRNRLGDQRLNLLMQRYMRDLRRTAFIDLRG
jgi:peptidyl-prolyl cis-trans isomerase SurA